jgi:hypothetical protein
VGDFDVSVNFKLGFLNLPDSPHLIYPIHKFCKVSRDALYLLSQPSKENI